ncbi:FliH/SctL family protein [Neokomagataea anthophila]|uniref:Flagellar assembly protein FliH/Type III secretion system HrpE domain-containing protein n=1 Tax=Neokomagataea anthophila TaxID=2826925 RepID=A0ABS5E8K0_9PROT|nr:hypothetical protein [Neokomagataea anthophila]MBR0560235.1 hypothetical protein [Neokomagataea anthophila]
MMPSAHISLFSEDFDPPVPVPDDACHAVSEVEETPVKHFTEAEYAAARQEGFEEGVRFGREHAAAEHELQRCAFERSVNACVASIQVEVQEHISAAVEQAAVTLVEMTARLFPALLAEYGKEEWQLVMDRLLPLLKNVPNVECLMPVGEGALLQALCERQGVEFLKCTESDGLASGDFKVSWQGGEAVRDAQGVLHSLQNVLSKCLSKKGE